MGPAVGAAQTDDEVIVAKDAPRQWRDLPE